MTLSRRLIAIAGLYSVVEADKLAAMLSNPKWAHNINKLVRPFHSKD